MPNRLLPPQHSGENTASAAGAIKAITENPNATIDQLASIVHEQWKERNTWAATEPSSQHLMKPYEQLAEAEKEKDRSVVRVAQKAIATVEVQTPDTRCQDGSVTTHTPNRQRG